MSRDIFFNGTNLNTITNFEVTHIYANVTPSIELAKSRYGFADGSAIQKHSYDNKIITVKGRTIGDRNKFDVARAELEALFYNQLGKKLQYEDNSELVDYTATLNSLNFAEPQGGHSEVVLNFETTTPFYTKGDFITVTDTIDGGDIIALGTVGGTIPAEATITIDINTWSGGASTDIQTIAVTWTGGFCNIIGIFVATDQIEINLKEATVTLNGDSILYYSDFGGLSVGTNSITAECTAITDNYNVSVEYKKRYL